MKENAPGYIARRANGLIQALSARGREEQSLPATRNDRFAFG
jgi:hypothetical protein